MKRKLRVVISAGLAAITLSASAAFACTTMTGTTNLVTVGNPPVPWTGQSIARGSKIGMWADDVSIYINTSTTWKIDWLMLEDNQGTYCHAGNVEEIGDGGPWQGPSTGVAGSTFDIGSIVAPESGTLMTGRLWKGGIYLCFGDGGYSAWPVYVTVT